MMPSAWFRQLQQHLAHAAGNFAGGRDFNQPWDLRGRFIRGAEFCQVFDSRVRTFVRVCITLPETMRNLFVGRVEFDHLKPDSGVAAFVAYDLVSPQETHSI
jgi:hypothetical protein